MSLTPDFSIISALNAETATGTSCRLCSRFCAVTITSSRTLWDRAAGLIDTAVTAAMATASLRELREVMGMATDPLIIVKTDDTQSSEWMKNKRPINPSPAARWLQTVTAPGPGECYTARLTVNPSMQ